MHRLISKVHKCTLQRYHPLWLCLAAMHASKPSIHAALQVSPTETNTILFSAAPTRAEIPMKDARKKVRI